MGGVGLPSALHRNSVGSFRFTTVSDGCSIIRGGLSWPVKVKKEKDEFFGHYIGFYHLECPMRGQCIL